MPQLKNVHRMNNVYPMCIDLFLAGGGLLVQINCIKKSTKGRDSFCVHNWVPQSHKWTSCFMKYGYESSGTDHVLLRSLTNRPCAITTTQEQTKHHYEASGSNPVPLRRFRNILCAVLKPQEQTMCCFEASGTDLVLLRSLRNCLCAVTKTQEWTTHH